MHAPGDGVDERVEHAGLQVDLGRRRRQGRRKRQREADDGTHVGPAPREEDAVPGICRCAGRQRQVDAGRRGLAQARAFVPEMEMLMGERRENSGRGGGRTIQ